MRVSIPSSAIAHRDAASARPSRTLASPRSFPGVRRVAKRPKKSGGGVPKTSIRSASADLSPRKQRTTDPSPGPVPLLVRSAFTGTLTTQLKTLLDARAQSRPAAAPPAPKPKSGKKRKGSGTAAEDDSLPPPPVKGLDALALPESEWQPTRLRERMFVKKNGAFCCSTCATHPVATMRERAEGKWKAFVDAIGGVPRADRRCLLLGAKILAVALAGEPDAVNGVAHLCSRPVWDLAPSNVDDADEYRKNVRKAVEASWPKLKAALTAAFGADVTKGNGRNGDGVVPCTLETYARLCGATQMNALAVKVPHPLMKYVVSTVAAEGALTEHVQWLVREKAERVARKALEEEKVLGGLMDIDDIDLDSDSDDDETRDANGDERYSFRWGSGEDEGFDFDTTVFPAYKGSAIFPLASSLNHSCDPNCEVAYVDDSRVHILAKRTIARDEECTIAYVDPDLDGEERREELKETYGFDCECDVCIREGFVPHLKRRKVLPPKESGGGLIWGKLDAELKARFKAEKQAAEKAAKKGARGPKQAPAKKAAAETKKTPAKKATPAKKTAAETKKTPAKKATPKATAKGGKAAKAAKANPVAVSEDDKYDDLPADFEDEEIPEEEAFAPSDDKKYAKIFGGLDLPDDFDDEEIDEDAAFTAEDKKKYGKIFSPATKKTETKKAAAPKAKAEAKKTPAKKATPAKKTAAETKKTPAKKAATPPAKTPKTPAARSGAKRKAPEPVSTRRSTRSGK